tara:strand:+ start:343 stop:852 length:510 start_codon:yes stop_codon:yes gene_type:complete
MEAEYIELVLNDRLIRIDKNDSMNIWYWRDWFIKTPKWVKKKISLRLDKNTEYKSYRFGLNKKNYILSRVVYKAHNPDWDITDSSENNQIDHININSLDNRIENLRVLTSQQNKWNTSAKGYYKCKYTNKWRAEIRVSGKCIKIGRFTEEADARQAYLNAKEIHHKVPA